MCKQTTILKTFIVVVVVTVIFIGLKKKMNPSSQDVSHKDKIRYKHPTRGNWWELKIEGLSKIRLSLFQPNFISMNGLDGDVLLKYED